MQRTLALVAGAPQSFNFSPSLCNLQYIDNQQTTTDMATTSISAMQTPCRLLSLPGELKNRIYRLVLVKSEDNPIVVTSTGYDRGGGLLQTCKEVRREGLKIFDYENKFTHLVRRYNCTPVYEFVHSLESCSRVIDPGKVNLDGANDGEPCWSNVLRWLRRIHNYKVLPCVDDLGTEQLRRENVTDMESHTQRIMFSIAARLQDQPWDFVEDMLVGMRPSLVVVDERWAEG